VQARTARPGFFACVAPRLWHKTINLRFRMNARSATHMSLRSQQRALLKRLGGLALYAAALLALYAALVGAIALVFRNFSFANRSF
jgi:hypothetical protein